MRLSLRYRLLTRTTAFMTHNNLILSLETEMMRHLHKLASRDLSLDTAMILSTVQ